MIIRILPTFLLFASLSCGLFAQTAPTENLPPLPAAYLVELFPKVNQVDFIFNKLPITTNASDKDAQAALTMIAADSVAVQGCAPRFATMIFTGSEGMLFNGDVFFANGCTYFQITYKGKRYANLMTEGAFNYFNQIIRHVQESGKH